MKVSVIIPNFNGEQYLKKCLESLMQQTIKDFEIIVVDNGSKDGSIEILDRYPEIKIIRNNKNLGFSPAVNQGIRVALGEYVALLNNDTIVFEDWLEQLVKCIEKDMKIFSVSSMMIRNMERNLIDDAGDNYTIMGWAYKRGDGKAIKEEINSREVFSSCAGAALYRKEVLIDIGLFDESFFAYMEDVDLGYRARNYGYKNVYCSYAKVYHAFSATSGSRYNAFKIKLAAQNNVLVILNNMVLWQRVMNGPFLRIGFLVKALFFNRMGFGKVYVDGLLSGIEKGRQNGFNHKGTLALSLKVEVLMIVQTFEYAFDLMKRLKNRFMA